MGFTVGLWLVGCLSFCGLLWIVNISGIDEGTREADKKILKAIDLNEEIVLTRDGVEYTIKPSIISKKEVK